MGAEPRVALLSLALPDAFPIADVDALLDGLLSLAEEARVSLVGGNITRSPSLLYVDITAVGSVHPRRIVTRANGRPGDELYVTGSIGGAAAGLERLRARGLESPLPVCAAHYSRPQPRVRAGIAIGRTRVASACVDLSDGLADGVAQIARASGTGAIVDGDALPIEPSAREWFAESGTDPVIAAMIGGEDYELLFAVRPRHRGRLRALRPLLRGVPLTRVGHLTADRALQVVRAGVAEPLPEGFVHFG
jgi:thiamine-monophosphate kinase